MPKFWKRKSPYDLRSRKNKHSTPKPKVDACVECDLPFDEDEIAPELRRVPIAKEGTSPEPLEIYQKDAEGFNKTDLEPVDISVDSNSDESYSVLAPPVLSSSTDTEEENNSEKEKEQEKEKQNIIGEVGATGGKQVPVSTTPFAGEGTTANTISAGGQQVPVINSPADIYDHFARKRLSYDEDIQEDLNSEEHFASSDKIESSSDTDSDDFLRNSDKRESSATRDSTTGTMQAEVVTELQDQIASLRQELLEQQERSRRQTINAVEHAPLPDTTSTHRPPAFHGFDSEDINRWLDKVENYLKLRRINTGTPTALAELVLNLAGPAEDFYYSLEEDKRDTYDKLRDALRERFANENQSWIIWQAITTRQQGPVESLDTYLTDLTAKFRRINISDADKMRYFVQGLRANLRETVLLKQPKSFREAEEMARLAAAVKTTMGNSNETMAVQLNNLTKTLNTMVAGTSSPSNTCQQQAMQTQLDVITRKLDNLTTPSPKTEKVAAYSESPRRDESNIFQLMNELKEDLSRKFDHIDRRINGLANRERDTRDNRERDTRNNRQRSRDGRPLCFYCGSEGHLLVSCPQRNAQERRPAARNALPAPEGVTRRTFQPGFQPRQRALPPSDRQNRVAAVLDDFAEPIYDYLAFMWPDGEDLEEGDYYDAYDGGVADGYGEWDYYYDYEPEEIGYDQPTEIELVSGQVVGQLSKTDICVDTTTDHETADQTLGRVCTFSSRLLNKKDFKEIQTADQLVGPKPVSDPEKLSDGTGKENFSSRSLADETTDHLSLAKNDLQGEKENLDLFALPPHNLPEMSLTTGEAVSEDFPSKAEATDQYVETTLTGDIPPKSENVVQFSERPMGEAQAPELETADKPGEPPKTDNFTSQETSAEPIMPQDAVPGELTEIIIEVPRPKVVGKQVMFAVFPPPKADYELEIHTKEIVTKSAGDDVLQPDDQRYQSQSYPDDARFPLNEEKEHVVDYERLANKTTSTIATQANADHREPKPVVPTGEVPVSRQNNSHNALKSTDERRRRADQPIGKLASTGPTPPPMDLTVEVWINDKPMRCLVDTGAAVSVLDARQLMKLYDDCPPPLVQSQSKSLKTVNGESMAVRGILKTNISIAGGNYPCEFRVIEGVEYCGVLGRDFLRATRANIDFDEYTLQLKDETPVTFSEDLLSVIASETYVIPPQSETVIPAKIKSNVQPGTIGLIESTARLAGRYELQGAAALVKVAKDESVPFRLINPTNKPVTLYKGASLGTFSEADGDPDVIPVGECNTIQPSQQEPDDVPVDLQGSALTPEQQEQLKALLKEYRDIFAVKPEELGSTDLVQHHIDTGDNAPLRSRPYRVPHAQKETIENHINDMLSRDVIQPSTSPWASPVVLVPKPDGSTRFCCDFRRLNQITKKDSYPLPLISESLEVLGGARYFSSIDLMSGYWQVKLDAQSREKTAFVTHAGLYEFTTMPFGLCNAPGTFQRLMECVLRGLNWQIALIYLDDVLVYSKTFEEHLQHLRLVFDRFRAAGLKLKPSKCHFGQSKVNYLGHVITPDGLQPDPAKIKAVQEYPVPSSVKDIRAFMGLANYYRKFVKNFAKIASPLHV